MERKPKTAQQIYETHHKKHSLKNVPVHPSTLSAQPPRNEHGASAKDYPGLASTTDWRRVGQDRDGCHCKTLVSKHPRAQSKNPEKTQAQQHMCVERLLLSTEHKKNSKQDKKHTSYFQRRYTAPVHRHRVAQHTRIPAGRARHRNARARAPARHRPGLWLGTRRSVRRG